MIRTKRPDPVPMHDYDIRMRDDGNVVLFTRYKGRSFEGWITRENMERIEAMGVLSWDEAGNPVISEPKQGEAK